MMKRYFHVRGMATLMMTMMVTFVMVMVSFATFKASLYQMKRAQNFITLRQSHWRAEGAIECLYAYLQQHTFSAFEQHTRFDKIISDSQCLSSLVSTQLDVSQEPDGSGLIHAKDNAYNISRRFHYGPKVGEGVVVLNAKAHFIGQVEFMPDTLRYPRQSGLFPCVSVRFLDEVKYSQGGRLSAQLLTQQPAVNGPYPQFEGECASSHRTTLRQHDSTQNPQHGFAQDFVQDLTISPFSSYFLRAKSPSNIRQLKRQFRLVNITNLEQAHQCASIINRLISLGYSRVWVNGHCLIDSPISSYKPISLVVEGGIFAAIGEHEFLGSMLYLIDTTLAQNRTLNEVWKSVRFYPQIKADLSDKTFYFSEGHFAPQGGIYIDALGVEAVFKDIGVFEYRANAHPFERSKVLEWQPGGWFAF